jgi:hypothetical protein
MKISKRIGMLLGITLIGGAAIIPFTTSCGKKNDTTINQATFNNNQKYQVSEDTAIYTSSTYTIENHNTFFDLRKFSKDNGNATKFYISGTINFGILVGFDENVSLYGENGCLISLINQTEDTYGILVGSTVAGSDTYTGNMYVDESISANIVSSGYAYGVYFNSTTSGSIQNIDGNFSVSSEDFAFGVYFYSSAADSTQNVNGNFLVSSSYGNAYGVYFNSTAAGSAQNVNGNFSISGWDNANGVFFNSAGASSLTINGNFSIFSDDFAYGVYFNSTASGSIQNINGNFSISSSSGSAYGVYFSSSAYGTRLGTPTFYSNKTDSGN